MKNLFIVLLIAAIGVGVYLYFRQKEKEPSTDPKELILGKWKIDSIVDSNMDTARRDGLFLAIDSALKGYEVEVRKNIFISRGLRDEMRDTGYYQFMGDRNVVTWSDSDKVKTKWEVERLDTAVLILKDKDSALFYLRRVK